VTAGGAGGGAISGTGPAFGEAPPGADPSEVVLEEVRWLLSRLAPAAPTPSTSSIARMTTGYGLRDCFGTP
jgi:hypothetical protein